MQLVLGHQLLVEGLADDPAVDDERASARDGRSAGPLGPEREPVDR